MAESSRPASTDQHIGIVVNKSSARSYIFCTPALPIYATKILQIVAQATQVGNRPLPIAHTCMQPLASTGQWAIGGKKNIEFVIIQPATAYCPICKLSNWCDLISSCCAPKRKMAIYEGHIKNCGIRYFGQIEIYLDFLYG